MPWQWGPSQRGGSAWAERGGTGSARDIEQAIQQDTSKDVKTKKLNVDIIKSQSELESLVKPCQVHLLKLQQSKGHYKAEDIVKSSREDLPARIFVPRILANKKECKNTRISWRKSLTISRVDTRTCVENLPNFVCDSNDSLNDYTDLMNTK